jgi:hypothetical protein
MANEAGIPITGMLMMDRSIAWVSCGPIHYSRKNVLRPKRPLSRSPIVNNVKPKKNWLPFPTVGTKGLPTALSQTWCKDDSISFELDRRWVWRENLWSCRILVERYRIVSEVPEEDANVAFSFLAWFSPGKTRHRHN